MLTSVGLTLAPHEQEELQIDAQLTKPVRRRELRRILTGAVGSPVVATAWASAIVGANCSGWSTR